MKLCTIIILFFFTSSAQAGNFSPVRGKVEQSGYSQIVVDSLWEQLGHQAPAPIPIRKDVPVDVKPTPSPTPSPAPAPNKSTLKKPSKITFPDTKKKVVKNKPLKIDVIKNKINTVNGSTEKKDPLAKYRSKNGGGNNKIQEMLRRNREKLKQRQANANKKNNSPKKEESLHELRNKGLNKLKKRVSNTYSAWQTQLKETYRRWSKMKKVYEKKIPQYQDATFEFESASFSGSKKSDLKKPLSKAIKEQFHIIPGALDVAMRDQGRRPTCAAFAGVRAIETMLQGHGVEQDLSEQFFYWSSKPRCQKSPCAQRGSWIANAYKKSKRSSRPDIPSDKSCPYKGKSVNGNETQTPLRPTCNQGVVKVTGYSSLSSIDDIYQSLSNNKPVVGGFKLSPNFYKTQGLVKLQDSYASGSTDSHAAGHALLLIGHMQLPKELHKTEGKICFVTANSWGEGWGKGGFGCLTEKWVQNYRIPNAFMSLNGIKM